jgi:hypothetical protein
MGISLKYGLAEKEFATDMKPAAQALILTHAECGGFGKDFNSAARTMLKGHERARKNLREQLDWRKDNPGITPPDGMPYKNLTGKSVLMLDLLWFCTIDGGKNYWGEECLRLRNMLGYRNLRPTPAQTRRPPPPTQEDSPRRAATPVHAAVALATIPEANQEDILASPEGTTMPTPTTPTTPTAPPARAARSMDPVFVVLAQCDGRSQMAAMVREVCAMSKEDQAKLLAYLAAAPK